MTDQSRPGGWCVSWRSARLRRSRPRTRCPLLLVGLAVFTVSLILAPLAMEAQQPRNIPRIGMLSPGVPSQNPRTLEAFRQGLHELGYVEGQNILLERRYAEGRVERFADLAAELVRLVPSPVALRGGVVTSA